jgi:hypothetical protein
MAGKKSLLFETIQMLQNTATVLFDRVVVDIRNRWQRRDGLFHFVFFRHLVELGDDDGLDILPSKTKCKIK